MRFAKAATTYLFALSSPFVLVPVAASENVKRDGKEFLTKKGRIVKKTDSGKYEIDTGGDDTTTNTVVGTTGVKGKREHRIDSLVKKGRLARKGRVRNSAEFKFKTRRKLSGKGKDVDDDENFYRFPCEFCGKGNDSALNLSGNVSCFSPDVSVTVQGRGRVTMQELQVGDKVLTQEGSYEPVYAFGHHEPNKEATFLQIRSASGQTLELTNDHLVYLVNKHNPVRAVTVKVGDMLRSCNVDMNMTITDIVPVQKTGMYAPLTLGGNIVVDNNIVASSYISLQDTSRGKNTNNGKTTTTSQASEYMVLQAGSKVEIPIMSHHQYVDIALAPYRLACRLFGNALCDTTKTEGDGIPLYIKWGIGFNQWSATHLNAHPLVMLATIVATGPFWCLDRSLFLNNGGINWVGLTALFMVVAAWIALKRNRVTFVVARKVKTA